MLEETAPRSEGPSLRALTPREREVLEVVASGVTNAEAAERLDLSVHAIKFHLAGVYTRLGVSNRTEAAVAYLRLTNSVAGEQEGN
jgi:two-component system, NarL family, nitrate/nitrite response regulator NarL